MHTQINMLTRKKCGILPQQGNTKTIQKDNPKLLDRLSIDIRVKHYSRKTEESYSSWIKRFILFNN